MSTVPTTPAGARPAGGTGDPRLGLPAVVREFVHQALDTGGVGATLDQHGQPYRGDGLIVALPEYGASIPGAVLRSLKREQVEWLVGCWVEGRAPEVIGTYLRPRYFGAWIDGEGTLWVDVVEAYSSEDRDLAVIAGHARNQVAIWDSGRQVEIPTGGTGAVTEHAPFRINA